MAGEVGSRRVCAAAAEDTLLRDNNMNDKQQNLPTRRHLIQAMGGGMGSLGLLSAMNAQANGKLQAAHVPAKTKRVIQLFMNGGPFQGDLFDPKPQLLKFAGQRPAEANLRTERRGSDAVALSISSRGRKRHPGKRTPAADLAMRRRHGNHSFHVYRQSQPRPCSAADE